MAKITTCQRHGGEHAQQGEPGEDGERLDEPRRRRGALGVRDSRHFGRQDTRAATTRQNSIATEAHHVFSGGLRTTCASWASIVALHRVSKELVGKR